MVGFLTEEDLKEIESHRLDFCEVYITMFIRSMIEISCREPYAPLLEILETKCSITTSLIHVALSGDIQKDDRPNPIIQPGRAYLVEWINCDHVAIIITGYDKYQIIHSYMSAFHLRAEFIDCIGCIGFDRLTNKELHLPAFEAGVKWCEIPVNGKSIAENFQDRYTKLGIEIAS